MSNTFNRQFHSTQKNKLVFKSLLLLLLVAAIFIGVWQIDQVREFFGRASGVPAELVIDTQAVIGPMPRSWQHLAQGGEDYAWRMQPIANPVRALRPQYIRIDHIYDFYDIVQGSPGNLSFNFSKLDPILDDILAVGAKPYIALSYMPPAISRGDIVDMPHNWTDWQLTVQRTIEHISGTRGITDVYYEVWNEPDLFGGWKYYGSKNYLTLYSYAAMGASSARNVRPFKLGGPGITALYKNWFNALAKHAINNNLRFDFFSWHRYDHDVDQFIEDAELATVWKYRYPELAPTLELHITEWGPDSENHAVYDGYYSAAHAVATAIAINNRVNRAFVFEIQDGKDPQGQEYWGRWGLMTHQDFGSKIKPRYRALQMLDRVSNQRLQITGQGSWVKALAARNARFNTEIVMANFDQYGSHTEAVPITFENIQPGSYNLNLEFLNGRRQTVPVATTAALVRTQVVMPPNSVVFGELVPE